MQILKEAPDSYIQQCKYCGAVLKYSEFDIIPSGKSYANPDGNGWGVCFYDSFECPSCHCRNEALRRWMMEN
jgi:hypothetical protein